VAGVLAAVVCGLGGLLVPALIRRIPEPDEPPEDKEPYAAIAALPGLVWKAAVAAAVAGALVGAAIGLSWPLAFLLPLVPVGVALALVDWRTRLLPTRVIAPTYVALVPVVVLVGLLDGDTAALVRAGVGWLLAGGFFVVLWLVHPGGLGYGDVRLSGILGIVLGYLGWSELFWGLWAGFLLGGVGGLVLARLGLVDRRANPFGPWMLIGAVVGILWGAAAGAAVFG
jgi:leader peptidase (prepilin peptidase)/N-methyltransferase